MSKSQPPDTTAGGLNTDFVELMWQIGISGNHLTERLACICAIPHWFDESIARALTGSGLDDVTGRLATKYPSFVKTHPKGYSYHESIRLAFWRKWHQDRLEDLQELSARLVAYFDEAIPTLPVTARLDYEYERMYHITTIDAKRGLQLFDRLFQTAQDYYKIEACHWLVNLMYEQYDYLPSRHRNQLRYYEGEVAREQHNTELAETILLELVNHPDTDVLTKAKVLNGLALSAVSRNALDDSITYLHRSIEILEKFEDWYWQVVVLYNMATLTRLKGFRTDALRYSEMALNIAQKHAKRNDIPWLIKKSRILSEIGHIRWMLGQPQLARPLFLEALEVQLQAGATSAAAETYAHLGRLERTTGDWEKAISHFQNSLKLATQTENKSQLAWAKNALGNVFVQMQMWEAARNCFEESREIWESLNRQHERGVPLKNLIVGCTALGEWDLAEKYAQESLEIFANHEGRQGEIYNNLGRLYTAVKQFDKSRKYLVESLEIATRHGDSKTKTSALVNLGELNVGLENWKLARQYAMRALENGREYQQLDRVAQASLILGEIELREGRIEEASKWFFEACSSARSFNKKTYEIILARITDILKQEYCSDAQVQVDLPSFLERIRSVWPDDKDNMLAEVISTFNTE